MGRQKTLFEKRIIEYWHLSKYDFESEFTNSAKSRLMKKLRQNKRIYTFSFTTLYYDAEASDRHESMLDKKGNQIRPNWVDQELISQLAGDPVYDHQEFIDNVLNYISMMQPGPWRKIVQSVYNEYEELIWTSPAAASMHHDMNGGLALHTLTMTQSAVALYDVYKNLYPNLNLDLLIAGTLLHDVGKVIELSGPIATHYTGIGVLEGHIVIGANAIQQAAVRLGYDPNSEDVQLLVHMVLAHHLKGEWGSPVSPAFIEAQLLHNIDKIDADIQEFKKTEAEIGVGEATNGRWHGIDGRVYRPYIHPEG